MRDYIVTFDTYCNHIASNWQIGITANNAKEAREIAKDKWHRSSHMFHLVAKRGTADPKFVEVKWFHYPVKR